MQVLLDLDLFMQQVVLHGQLPLCRVESRLLPDRRRSVKLLAFQREQELPLSDEGRDRLAGGHGYSRLIVGVGELNKNVHELLLQGKEGSSKKGQHVPLHRF